MMPVKLWRGGLFMKKISCLFFALAILLSDVMCAVVAFKYAKMLCSSSKKKTVMKRAYHYADTLFYF